MKKLLTSLAIAGLMVGALSANAIVVRYGTDPNGGGGFSNAADASFSLPFGVDSQATAFNGPSSPPIPGGSGPIIPGAGTFINVSNFRVDSNITTPPGDSGMVTFDLMVRVAVAPAIPANTFTTAAPVGADFVDLPISITLNLHDYYFDTVNSAGSGGGDLVTTTPFVQGNTNLTNTLIRLDFVSFDALDFLSPNPAFGDPSDPSGGFAYTTQFDPNRSSLTYRLTAVPEPGTVALVVGLGIPGLLLTGRRLRRRK